MKNKTERQLYGILPITSFKVEVTSDLGPLENGNIVDIKRQTISVVVDGLNEEVYIDQALKQQIFATVAGAVGYVRGRDSIQLSVAEFPLYTEEEKKAIRQRHAQKGIINYLFMTLLGIAVLGALFWGFKKIRAIVKQRQKEKEELQEKEVELEGELEDFEEPPEEVKNNDEKVTEIKNIAASNPEILSGIMEDWIKSDEGVEEVAELAEEPAEEPIEEEVAL